jgi:uncharacterized membrane protein
MVPFYLLLVSWLVFRALGWFGVEWFATWQASARYGVALMFIFTGTLHFTKMKEDFARMIPDGLPGKMGWVYFSGVCQLLGAIGLLLPSIESIAGFCLVLLLVAMFPANYNAARNEIPFRNKPPTPLWQRLGAQVVFIGITWWASQA